nr:hypothetical protein HK105_007555 [Polyrhizophydium stewartii]
MSSLSLPPLDFRAQLLLLVDVLPLAVAVILLMFFQPIYIILWYLLLLASMAAIICGALLMSLPTTSIWYSIPPLAPVLLLVCGCVVFAAMVWLYWFTNQRKRNKRRRHGRASSVHPTKSQDEETERAMGFHQETDGSENSATDDDEENGRDKGSSVAEHKSKPILGSRAEYDDSDDEEDEKPYSSEPNLVSVRMKREYPRQPWWRLLIKSLVGLVLVYIGLCIGQFIPSAANVVSVTSTVVTSDSSFSSVPTSAAIVLIVVGGLFLINVTMGLFHGGREFMHQAKAFSLWNIGTFIFLFLSLAYIPISTSLLAVFGADSSLSCSAEILPYYGPGAVLMSFLICIGVPVLYYRLISLATRLVQSIPPNPEIMETTSQAWEVQMQLSTNLCRGLYYGFKYPWRYYSLIVLYQKIAIVAIFVFAALYPRYLTNLLNACCLFLNAVNSTVSLVIYMELYSFPSWLLYILMVLNCALPIGLTLYLILIDSRRAKKLAKKLNQHKKRDSVLGELISQIDEQMNAYTVKQLVRFFMAVGFAAFLSLSVTVVGFVRSLTSSNVFSSTVPSPAGSAADAALYEFAGYSSWSEFTQNCCCEIKTTSPASQAALNEVWKWRCGPIHFEGVNWRNNGALPFSIKSPVLFRTVFWVSSAVFFFLPFYSVERKVWPLRVRAWEEAKAAKAQQ